MFNRPFNGNNQQQRVSVNTNFYNSYSETALLKVGAWNQQLSIQLAPAIGKNASGVVQYAQDNSQIILTGIPRNNAIALLEGYKKHILPAIEQNVASPVISISVSEKEKRKIISVYYDGEDSWLEIAVNINADGTFDDSNVFKHKFGKKYYAIDYDRTTGKGTEVAVETDFMDFMNHVDRVKDLVPYQHHAKKYAEAIANMYKNNRNNNGGGNSFSQQPQVDVQNVGSDMSFLPFS